ncbi:class I SAM-dependent methyltransferase [Vulcanisaeta distributa]|uniref:class I SAM-dependent methyltransferase n=1 Tax=Vulcanisaeta distributa TaxID=164451 RepID=UPI001FB509FC|nr:class I SAM-dependent methyltransferase [Vulcanisaeta distributa]
MRVTRSFLNAAMYIGCELSLGMIKAAQEQIDWINCSATHIPIRPGSVDLVISIATLHHIPKHLVNAALRGGIHESLSPGGAYLWPPCGGL